MKAMSLLQVIYSFFLGLVVVGLVTIGINTFHPNVRPDGIGEQDWPAIQAAQEAWSLTTSIISLTAATLILALSLWRANRVPVISNGLLLGGIFTMIYAVGVSLSGDSNVIRFLVALAATIVTVLFGYLTFARRGPRAAYQQDEPSVDGGLDARVSALERRLDALGRALSD